MGNHQSRKGCRCLQWNGTKMKADGYQYGYNEREEWPCKSTQSVERHCSNGPHINNLYGDIYIEKFHDPYLFEGSPSCENCYEHSKKKGRVKRKMCLEERLTRKYSRCRQYSSSPFYSDTNDSDTCEIDNLSNFSCYGSDKHKLADRSTYQKNHVAGKPDRKGSAHALPQKDVGSQNGNIVNQNKALEKCQEPVQIAGSVQQDSTSQGVYLKDSRETRHTYIASHSSLNKQNKNSLTKTMKTADTSRKNTDTIKSTHRSNCDSGYKSTDLSVSDALNRDNSTDDRFNSNKNDRFESQNSVVSVRTNTDASRTTIVDTHKSEDMEVCYEFENTLEELGFNEVNLESNRTRRKCVSTENTYAKSRACRSEMTQHYEESVVRDESERCGKRTFSDSVFESDAENEETPTKLNLQCESDTEEMLCLKLPGPSFKQDSTELRRHVQSPVLTNLMPVPSSGYPFDTSTNFRNLSQDTIPDDSDEDSNTNLDTLKRKDVTIKKMYESSNEEVKLILHSTDNETDIKVTKESQGIQKTDINSDIETNIASDYLTVQLGIKAVKSTNENNVKERRRHHSCYEDCRNDTDILCATNGIDGLENGINSDWERNYFSVPCVGKWEALEGSPKKKFSSPVHFCNKENEVQKYTGSTEGSSQTQSEIIPCDKHTLDKSSIYKSENPANDSEMKTENTSSIEDPTPSEKLDESGIYKIEKVADDPEISNDHSERTSPDRASHDIKDSILPSENCRRRNISESSDTGYDTYSPGSGPYKRSDTSERKENTSMKTKPNKHYDSSKSQQFNTEVFEDRTSDMSPGGKSIKAKDCSYNLNLTCPISSNSGGQNCKTRYSCDSSKSYVVTRNEDFEHIPVYTYNCPNVLSVVIDKSDVNNTSLLKVSDEGVLREVTLGDLIESNKTETDPSTKDGEEIESEKQSASGTCTDKNKYHDETYCYKDGNENECCNSKQDITLDSRTACFKPIDLVNKGNIDLILSEYIGRKTRSFSESLTGFRYADTFTLVHEFHGFPIQPTKTNMLGSTTDSYACRALSESDLHNMKSKHFVNEIIKQEPGQTKTRENLYFKKKGSDSLMSSKNEHPSDVCNENNETQLEVHGQFSKTVSPTVDDNRKPKRRIRKKRKKMPKPEIHSLSFQQSMSSDSSSNSYRISNVKHKSRKGKSSWNRSFARHQRSRKIRSELSWGYTDSGISSFISCNSKSSSTQYRLTNYKAKSFKPERASEKALRRIIPCLTKKKSVKRLYRQFFKNFFRKEEKRVIKSVVRPFFVKPRRVEQIRVLESYFQRLTTGSPPSSQERMQYEWLRLATFRNYSGNGNTLALARNGFYHDHTEGPTSTRCFLCDYRRSNWERYDDISVEHRRQSPSCPFHENSGQESVNISIASGSTASETSAQTSRASAPTVTSTNTTTTATSSSAAAVSEARRSLQRTQISEASSSGGESISQQPSEDPESRDRSMLALPQARTQRALGRTGHTYSTIIAPRKNNVATGATSNVGIDPSGNGSSSAGSQIPGYRPSAILGGPVGSGAFAGLSALGQSTGAQTSVPRATEGLQRSNAQSSSSEGAAGAPQTNPAPGAGGRTDPNITVVVDNPKHPDYLNMDSRIGSYEGWPDYLDQTPRQMSEAGFFYVGVADFTRCFCCGGGLRNWEPGDDPMLEHTRWFPRCEYVNKLKGERYVAAVQRRHLEHMAEQQRQQIELAQRRDENRNPPDPMTTDAAAVMREMGYSVERTREAILAVRHQTGSALVTTQQVLTWLLDDEERRQNGDSDLGVRPPPRAVPSTETSVMGTSIASSIVFTGSSIASSIVYTGTSIGTSIVNTTSSISAATSKVSAGTTTSTVSSTSTSTIAEVQQSGTPASTTTEESSAGTENQQTGSVAGSVSSSSTSSASGTSVEKQSGASGGDSDEAKSAPKEDTTGSEAKSKATKKKNAKKKAKNKAGTKSETTGATGGDLDAKSLKAENEKLREMQTCKICMERPVNTTLLPCGHLVCCDNCAARLQRCPICRKRIKGTVKTFMS